MTDPAGFIGREREVVDLVAMLNDNRSLALVGPSGIGKSSLLIHLLHVGPVLLNRPSESVLLDLASVKTPADLYRPMLQALGLEGDDELSIATGLQDRHLLVGLDNLERAGPGLNRVVRSALRAHVQSGQLQIIIASDVPLADTAPDLSADLVEVRVGPMPEREARALAEEMLARADEEASAAEIGLLVAVAGGHPARLRRAVELWLRSERGASFDWQRTFREEYPQPAQLANTVTPSSPQLETEAASPESRLVRRLKKSLGSDEKELRTYESEDISAFLLAIVVVATLLLAACIPTTWLMRLLALAVAFLVLAVLVPWAGLQSRWRNSESFQTYLEGLRMLPGMRSLLKRFDRGGSNQES
ncbi:MAG: hypothetical protein KatS3mg057_1336 [Herpetosiphonaceae bacterium]|nr:MAG: hypothetical protein KatS3mg057_1336 [Herpetosiphonaceae bacterium]